MIEAQSTSETSVNFYQTTRRNNSEDSHLHTRRRENLKSHSFFIAYDTRRHFMPHFVRILGTLMESLLSLQ
jgi:hypothetical protein